MVRTGVLPVIAPVVLTAVAAVGIWTGGVTSGPGIAVTGNDVAETERERTHRCRVEVWSTAGISSTCKL